MKYQVFNKEQQKQIAETLELIKETLRNAKKTEMSLRGEVNKSFKDAKDLEERYGAEDSLTQTAWRTFSWQSDDLDALQSRIEELEDAERFNQRLLKL